MKIDPKLYEYATPRQREFLEAWEAHGTLSEAGRQLGVDARNISLAHERVARKAAKHGYSPAHDMTRSVPDGFRAKGVSTLYNKEGKIAAQWVKSQVDWQRQIEMMQEAAETLAQELPHEDPIEPPEHTIENLMSIYPVGDHHIGMLSWADETGNDYDTASAERLLMAAMSALVKKAPKSKVGALVLLGDFLHYDSYETLTVAHKHLLDSDTRYPRLVQAAMKVVKFSIRQMLKHHEEVRVVVASGNHDPSSMVFLREALSVIYENEKRVYVDKSPRMFHYIRFGKNLIGVHHGDKVKMQDLPLLMATDRPKDWGDTEFRYIYTGHIHHDSVKEYNGARVESFRVLAPNDAHGYNSGYRSGRDMKRIELHKDHGEVARALITPQMLL